MHNKRLLIAILFFILAGIALVAGFTRLELSPESPQVIIYPAAALALVGLVQLWIYWRKTYRAK